MMTKYLILLLMIFTGCATKSGLIEKSENYSTKYYDNVNKSNFSRDGSASSKLALGLLCLPCMAADGSSHSTTKELDEKCLSEIKKVLEEKQPGTLGNLSINVRYRVLTGFMKEVALQTDWYGLDDEGKIEIHIRTIVPSEKALEMFPNTKSKKYNDIFVELAKKSAYDFISILNGIAPLYSLSSTNFY
jgi:hypothetical protein